MAGSPAIDAGDNSQCSAADQRGESRGQGAFFVTIPIQNDAIAVVDLGDDDCDIGAVEFD